MKCCGTSLLLVLLLCESRLVDASQVLARRAKEATIEVDGRTRTYYLFVPAQAEKPMPLVFVLHGGGNNSARSSKGRQMERYSGFNAIARREGFAVCYPEGIEGNWNDGREIPFIVANTEKVDDVRFLRQVVEVIGKQHRLDHSRIFATGISNGAFVSHRLAAEASDVFVAIAPLVGGMAKPIADKYQPEHPVSLFVIQGDSDPLVPLNGGEVGYRLGKKRGKFISTKDAVAKYLTRNGIQAKPEVSELPDEDPEDGTTTRRSVYPLGTGGARVQVYVVKNGGHAWPGRRAYLPEQLIGKVSQDFDASEEIWKFFESCPPRKHNK